MPQQPLQVRDAAATADQPEVKIAVVVDQSDVEGLTVERVSYETIVPGSSIVSGWTRAKRRPLPLRALARVRFLRRNVWVLVYGTPFRFSVISVFWTRRSWVSSDAASTSRILACCACL